MTDVQKIAFDTLKAGAPGLSDQTREALAGSIARKVALSTTPARAEAQDEGAAGERSGIYVASRASVPARGEMWRTLRAGGAPIISTWIDEDGEGQSHDLGELWERILREVTSAERLILYVEPDDFPLKGAFIEVGMALAAGVPVFVVSPGVALEARSLRPLGSWALHPLVTLCQTMGDALHGAKPAHPSPTPAADADRARIAVEALEPFSRLLPDGIWQEDDDVECVVQASHLRAATKALAALKSTAAKEGAAK